MGVDFDNLYNKCQDSFDELKKCMSKVYFMNQKGTLKYQTQNVIMKKILEICSNLRGAMSDPESFHLNYLYVLCQLEALDALLWVLRMNPDCVRAEAETFQSRTPKASDMCKIIG